MKIKKIELDNERKIIINLIMSTQYCKEVLPLVRPQYWSTNYAREVSSWVEEYYNQFKSAPQKNIKSIYHTKKINIKDDTQDEISVFLSSISKQYEDEEVKNYDYEIANGISYLKLRSLEYLKEVIDDCIINNKVEQGELAVSSFKRVEKPMGAGISLLRDADKIASAFNMEEQILITFPGELNKVISPIKRGDFFSYFGPAARGKTFWLWFTGELGLEQGCKVLFLTLEMTEAEIIRRAYPSISRRPKNDMDVSSAYFEKDSDSGKWVVEQKKEFRKGIELNNIAQFQKKLKTRFRRGDIRIICPGDEINVEGIISKLDTLEHYDNFIPDILIIDYADYMSASKNFKSNDYRHSLNNIWKGLRDLSIRRNLAIVTASHTETKTFDTDVKISHASEDKRKLNHVTMGFGLNQTEEEAKNNIMRISALKLREGKKAFDQAVVVQCLDIGRPCIDSRLRSDVIVKKDEESENKTSYKRKIRD